jgi:hypothetical protein
MIVQRLRRIGIWGKGQRSAAEERVQRSAMKFSLKRSDRTYKEFARYVAKQNAEGARP